VVAFLTAATSKDATGEVKSGRTKADREDFVLIEKPQPRLPLASGLSLATGKGKRGRRGGLKSSLPPAWKSPVYRSRLQYQASSNVSASNITRGMLGSTVGVIGVVLNTTAAAVASSFRLRSIRCWPAAGSSVDVIWVTNTAEQALQRDKTDFKIVPTGVTETGMTVVKPPKGTWAAMWQATNENATDVLFSISCAQGSVLEISLDFTFPTGIPPYGQTLAVVSVGQWYYPPLDGTNNKLPPVVLQTTH